MASAFPSMDVKEELKCPVCMEYLIDPVTLDCGHNFCRDCITAYCEAWEDLGDLECPLCKAKIKKRSFQPNWQLASIAEKIRDLLPNQGKKDLCAKHQEKLNLFCKEDQELVCVRCERTPDHQSHAVLLLEDAAKEYKDKLCSCLEVLRMERDTILESKAGIEKESQDLLSQIEAEKTKTMTLFSQLHQFLVEQEKLFLAHLEEPKEEIETRRDDHMARLLEELSSLAGLIQQMEEKCQQSEDELLQDVGRTLQRYEEKEAFENPVVFPPELTCRIGTFLDINPLLEGVVKQFQANVTLDPDTAHPQLILSEDCRSVWCLPNNPERFNFCYFVLGQEGFTTGRHFWEVVVGSEEQWAVGVARKSVRRKGWLVFSPEEGIWAVGKWGGGFRAVSSPGYTPLFLSQELKKIRVTLNCDEGQVDFLDADTGVPICTYI